MDIKIRDRSIKTIDRTSHRLKNEYIRMREETDKSNTDNPQQDAANRLERAREKGKQAVLQVGQASVSEVKKQIKDKIRKKEVLESQVKAENIHEKVQPYAENHTLGNFSNPTHSKQKSSLSGKSIQKSVKAPDKAMKASSKTIKTTDKYVKTSVNTAKSVNRPALAARKSLIKSKQTMQSAKEAARKSTQAAKMAVKITADTVKAAAAGTKSLIALLAGGGWVVVLVVVLISMAAYVCASPFGIFLDNDKQASISLKTAIENIQSEDRAYIAQIKKENIYDKLIENTSVNLKETLAVFAVCVSGDTKDGSLPSVLDGAKANTLRDVFQEINGISYYFTKETKIKEIEKKNKDGKIKKEKKEITVVTLHIERTGKTADEAAQLYGFTDEQKKQLNELLKPEYDSMWTALLNGTGSVHSSGNLVEIADSQLGNVGGQPYWSWYGFSSRVEWCACFVSWCANQAGYIQSGKVPKFSSCSSGVLWFKDRNKWKGRNYVPNPGDIIFFDWNHDGLSDHVGIVESSDGSNVHTIEGNTSDMCARRNYTAGENTILGYGIQN